MIIKMFEYLAIGLLILGLQNNSQNLISYSVGLFFGCATGLLALFILQIIQRKEIEKKQKELLKNMNSLIEKAKLRESIENEIFSSEISES